MDERNKVKLINYTAVSPCGSFFNGFSFFRSLLSSIVRLYHEKFLISSSLGTSVTFDKFIDENVVPRILRCFPPMWMTGK